MVESFVVPRVVQTPLEQTPPDPHDPLSQSELVEHAFLHERSLAQTSPGTWHLVLSRVVPRAVQTPAEQTPPLPHAPLSQSVSAAHDFLQLKSEAQISPETVHLALSCVLPMVVHAPLAQTPPDPQVPLLQSESLLQEPLHVKSLAQT